MKKFDTLIINGKVVTHEKIFDNLSIGVKDGKIAYLGEEKDLEAAQVIDAAGKYVLPGLIDIHTHIGGCNEGFPFDYALRGEAKNAALGGITTMYHMISEPASITDKLPKYKKEVEENSVIDIGFHACCQNVGQIEEIQSLADAGIGSFKFFLSYRGGREAQDNAKTGGSLDGVDYGKLYYGMEQVKKAGGTAMVHAENFELCTFFEDRYRGQDSFYARCMSRPAIAEEVDVFAICCMARDTGCPLYIVHNTVANSFEIAKAFREAGATIWCETSQNYLFVDYTGCDLKDPSLAFTTPPYKSPENREKLWEGVRAGKIHTINTDSSSISYKFKKGNGTIWDTWGGSNTTTTALASLVNGGVLTGKLTLPDVVRLTSYNNAKIFNIPNKGMLAPGYDADIVLLDMEKVVTVDNHNAPAKTSSDFSPFDGLTLTGWPVMTMCRGKIVAENGVVGDNEGWGKTVNLTI